MIGGNKTSPPRSGEKRHEDGDQHVEPTEANGDLLGLQVRGAHAQGQQRRKSENNERAAGLLRDSHRRQGHLCHGGESAILLEVVQLENLLVLAPLVRGQMLGVGIRDVVLPAGLHRADLLEEDT